MSDNPLDPSPETIQRIRERAYFLWLNDGSPEGREEEYWERARELQGIHDSTGAGQEDPTQADRPDEAELQDNLGEFPDRSADQGEHRVTPMTREQSERSAAE